MRVVALCDTVDAAARLWQRLGRMESIDLRLMLVGIPLGRARRGSPADWKMGLRLLLAGRLVLAPRGLEHRSTLARLCALHPDIGLCACRSTCGQPLLDCCERGILHPHPGLLPEYRGRAAMEWSIFEGRPTGISVYFLDAGTGTAREIVLRREVHVGPAPNLREAKRRLGQRDAEFFKEALERLRSPEYRPLLSHGRGRRFYDMSRLFTGVVEATLRSPSRPSRASGACT